MQEKTTRGRSMTEHTIATRERWLAAREDLLRREKEHTRVGDELAQLRRNLPWVPIDTEYTFDTADGRKSLAELFSSSSQLVIYHFMFGPSYEAGCPTNSSIADSFDGLLPHLKARDVTMICVSGAPLVKLLAFKQRMGWSFNWVSSYQTDFNYALGVSSTQKDTQGWLSPMIEEKTLPPIAIQNAKACGTDIVSYLAEGFGFNTFVRENETIYHSYSSGGRGVEFLMGYYPILDRTPTGRNEGEGFQTWLRRRDEYGVGEAQSEDINRRSNEGYETQGPTENFVD